MRRWDRLVDGYIEEYRGRGICEATVAHTESRLRQWGNWLKGRRPRPVLEDIDPQLHHRVDQADHPEAVTRLRIDRDREGVAGLRQTGVDQVLAGVVARRAR